MLRSLKPEAERDWSVLSLDSEQDENAISYVWCVYGIIRTADTEPYIIKKTFTNRKEVVKFLFHRRWRHTVLTGVNIAFDLNTLRYRGGYNWEEISNMGHLITASPSKKEMDKRKFRNAADHLKIIELGNFILNTSLKGMSDMFGLSGHIDKHILGQDGDLKEMSEACMSHARAGVLVFEELQKQLHAIGAHIRVTGASTAMDTYRRYYLPDFAQIYDFASVTRSGLARFMQDGDEETARFEMLKYVREIGKAAYVGGRCENFDLGKFEHQDYLDINSSYPFQMRERVYPNINTYRHRTGDLTALKGYLEDFEGQALIRVRAPKGIRIPFLHHKRDDGKLIFPLGEFAGWYTFPEIRKALSIGYKILDVVEIAIFDKMPSPFVAYVNEMMKLKVQPETKQAAKLLMNGLSGKFGQMAPTADKWREVEEGEDLNSLDPENLKPLVVGEENQLWYYDQSETVEEGDGFAVTSYPLLVAYITAWGRIQEYEAMQAIGFEHVHYMDTDSIIADREAVQKAISSGKIKTDKKQLGAYDLEHEDITIEIKGLKNYRIYEDNNYLYKMKGIPSRHMPEMWRTGEAHMMVAVKRKQALRTGKRINTFIPMVKTERVERDNKRVFEPIELIYHKESYGSNPYIIQD